jgi:hypothetical protein
MGSKESDGKELLKKENSVRELRLMDFSGDGKLSPEIIDDALKSTSSFYENIDIADITEKINNNKANYGAAT